MERKAPHASAVKAGPLGEFEAVFATFNVKDHEGDWTLPDAFEEGAEVPISAYGHQSWAGVLPVGKGVIRTDAREARIVGRLFLNTDHGRATFETLKELGELAQFSYGFDVLETATVTDELRALGVRRVLKKLKVHEVSPVLVGAGIGTRLVSAKGADREALEQIRADFQRGRYKFLMGLKDYEIAHERVNPDVLDAAAWAADHVARSCGFKAPSIRWFSASAPGTTRGFAVVGAFAEVWLRNTTSIQDTVEAAGHETAHAVGIDTDEGAGEIGRLAVKGWYATEPERSVTPLDDYARSLALASARR